MSNYTKTTSFTPKDSLSPGNPSKVVKGSEFDTEFDNIATAIASKADSTSAGSWVLIEAKTAANSATIDFTTGIDSTYDEYVIQVQNAIPSATAALWLRTSTDGGSTYDAGASDYGYQANSQAVNQDSVAQIQVCPTAGHSSTSGVCLTLFVVSPATAAYTQMHWTGSYITGTGLISPTGDGVGMRKANANVDAIRFLFSTGNIASGKFKLYGIKKS